VQTKVLDLKSKSKAILFQTKQSHFLQNWWSRDTYERFQEKNKCFIDHYNNYTFPLLGEIPNYNGPIGVNGRKTLGENIAGKICVKNE